MKQRLTPIQIAVASASDPESADYLFVLCSNGTIWRIPVTDPATLRSEHWREVPPIELIFDSQD